MAFGERHADKVQWVAGSLLDELDATGEQSYQVGDVVQFPGPDGIDAYAGAVLAVEQGRVLFDFNHPLAGKAVEFEAEVLAVL
jgi:FKBP-type peptidyl-prolyl cis-trans isomerase SlpA